MSNEKSTIVAELKSVTQRTTFRAVRVFDKAIERYALIDQDDQIVGLVEREAPFFINGTFSDACIAAKKGLRDGAAYQGYPCSGFGQHHYMLDTVFEPTTEFSDIKEVREAQELTNHAISLLNQIKSKQCNTPPPPSNEKIIN